MFKAFDKKSMKVREIYEVDRDMFLTTDDTGAFVYCEMDDFCAVLSGETAAPAPVPELARLSTVTVEEKTVDDIINGIINGGYQVHVGDVLSTSLKDGTEVDFVVTEVTDDAVRFDSRDCLGQTLHATEINDYLEWVASVMPDVICDKALFTARPYRDGDGEVWTPGRKFFLPSIPEMFPEDEVNGDNGLYTQMEYYKDRRNRIRCDRKGGDTEWYWTGSPRDGSSTYWCFVTNDGFANAIAASYNYYGAPVCFRVPRS